MDEDQKRLRNRVSKLEDTIGKLVKPQQKIHADEIGELRADLEDLEAAHEALQSRVASIIDVDSKSDSTPELRAVALREAMIRAARDRAGSTGGVTWWWQEVRDQLASHGHGDFSKPVYHSAIEDAAEKDGFMETTKDVLSGGRRREVKAIQLNPSKVTDAHLRNQLTTQKGATPGAKRAETDGGATTHD